MEKMPYFAGAYGTIPAIKFAEKLLEKLPRQDKVYFSNCGSEANEKAYKLVRQASQDQPRASGQIQDPVPGQ